MPVPSDIGREAIRIARTLGDRSTEVVATSYLGFTHLARGEFREAATLFERNVAPQGEVSTDRLGTTGIQLAVSKAWLADVLSETAASPCQMASLNRPRR